MNLLIHQGALGDWVLSFPLLRSLAPTHTLAVSAWSKANLAERLFEHVEAVHVEHPDFTRMHAAGGHNAISPRQCDRLKDVTQVFSFVSNGADAWAANIAKLVSPDAKLYFVKPRPPAEWRRHVLEWHGEQLREQGAVEQAHCLAMVGQAVEQGSGAVEQASRLFESPATGETPVPLQTTGETPVPPDATPASPANIVIHPGSGGEGKCWPRERIEALIEQLRDAGRNVRLVLGEVEADTWPAAQLNRWTDELGATVLDHVDDLCDVLLDAGCYIGNDSGPTHLAAQLGVPTVALFGPSDPCVWSPVGPAVRILASPSREPMAWLEVERVREAVEQIA